MIEACALAKCLYTLSGSTRAYMYRYTVQCHVLGPDAWRVQINRIYNKKAQRVSGARETGGVVLHLTKINFKNVQEGQH